MKFRKIFLMGIVASCLSAGCMKDLDQTPTIDPDSINEESVKNSPERIKQSLAKIYASLALTGQQGPAGMPDISGIDEGTSQFSRLLFYLQELPTDTAIMAWGDPGVPDFHNGNWTASNGIIEAMYYRLAIVSSYCNSFISIHQNTDNQEVKRYVAEARFVRAYVYSQLIDLFGSVPIITEIKTKISVSDVKTRVEAFDFVEKELKEIENILPEARQNEYGRVDKVAAQALLSRLYLNAQVYTGTNRYADCVTYSEKVINSAYQLHTDYQALFMADNDKNGAEKENIFTLNFDGLQSQTWAGTTFLTHATTGGSMNAANIGINNGWWGVRCVKEFVDKFEKVGTATPPTAWSDKRAKFHIDEQSYEIDNPSDVANFNKGYALTKFSNIRFSDGKAGKDPAGNFADTDLALIRLSEIYLNYAEALLRTSGNATEAINKVNAIRSRANAIPFTTLSLQNILDERARELHWEGFRRTDLIRFDQFTEATYLWTFKGGVKTGKAIEDFRKLYPISLNIINASDGVLQQNIGY